MLHFPKFWKHNDTKEVIDHQTYSDLDKEHRDDFNECDVTGEVIPPKMAYEQKDEITNPAPVENADTANLLKEFEDRKTTHGYGILKEDENGNYIAEFVPPTHLSEENSVDKNNENGNDIPAPLPEENAAENNDETVVGNVNEVKNEEI